MQLATKCLTCAVQNRTMISKDPCAVDVPESWTSSGDDEFVSANVTVSSAGPVNMPLVSKQMLHQFGVTVDLIRRFVT